MTDGHTTAGQIGQLSPSSGLKAVSSQNRPEGQADPQAHSRQQPAAETSGGITVEEEEMRLVSAQLVYKMRCECGRSWFELELLTFVKCPACKKVGIVSMQI